ncbi:hypothetical protein H8356DRAFT_1428007 [Neocallimastix lanati (nom. inval.)]|nr:hypothetical protein H8356DRAFT_1428007 [Neocallimastix sp. JGI-2020a]
MTKIPNYMILKYFIEIKYISTNINCKLDRKALPELSENNLFLNEYVKPEIKLCNIYSNILGINDIKKWKNEGIALSEVIDKRIKNHIDIENISKYNRNEYSIASQQFGNYV